MDLWAKGWPLLAMRFLPTDFHLDLHQASTAHSYPVTTPRHCPPTEPFALQTPLSPPPPPLPLYLPPIGQWQQPQAEHSGEPLGDPNARVIEVFLLVSQSVLTFPINSMPLPMNQVESPTQPKPYSTASLTDFPQVTAHASGLIVINSLLWPQPLELPA